MPIRVLVVDDSNFFQHRLKDIINENPNLKVVGIAGDGREAVEKAAALKPDIISMDYEMPVMDGVTAIKQIMANRKVPILMFSSLTYEGAKITLDALAAGALDFIPKDFSDVSRGAKSLKKKLHERLITLSAVKFDTALVPIAAPVVAPPVVKPIVKPVVASPAVSTVVTARTTSVPIAEPRKIPLRSVAEPIVGNKSAILKSRLESMEAALSEDADKLKIQPKLLIIGASTGGPVAMADVLVALPENFPLPIALVQHMPENFTKAYAERLNKLCKISVREAADGDQLKPGVALLAPGGKQMMIDKRNGGCVRVFLENDRVTYKPSLDITFGSAANAYGDKVLGVVLTGMGADGCEGARLLKEMGSTLWTQDEASCIIYGMPMAVVNAGLSDKVLPLSDIGLRLVKEIM
jgi:two-component system, chemotaxis family, protein-glutamate methylesterase/glutaminase